MGCPHEAVIGSNLTFSICTHDPDTAILTDADAEPIYRIYEDEVETPILTGTLSKLDNANTTGFYVETIVVSAANGFENNKTYTIYIEAIVDSDTGGISYGFKAKTSAGEDAGAGSTEYTLTVQDGSGVPIAGAEVWITTDEGGSNIVAGVQITDDVGQVTFLLDSGVTYYAWRDSADYNFTNPYQFTVS